MLTRPHKLEMPEKIYGGEMTRRVSTIGLDSRGNSPRMIAFDTAGKAMLV